MTPQKRSIEKNIGKILHEVFRAVDFDIESLAESDPEEIKDIVLEAVLSVIGEEKIPLIEWMNVVDEGDLEDFKADGMFVPN